MNITDYELKKQILLKFYHRNDFNNGDFKETTDNFMNTFLKFIEIFIKYFRYIYQKTNIREGNNIYKGSDKGHGQGFPHLNFDNFSKFINNFFDADLTNVQKYDVVPHLIKAKKNKPKEELIPNKNKENIVFTLFPILNTYYNFSMQRKLKDAVDKTIFLKYVFPSSNLSYVEKKNFINVRPNNNLPFFFASENIYEKYVKQEKGKINQKPPILNTRKIFEDKIKDEVLGESIRATKYPSDVISCFLNE